MTERRIILFPVEVLNRELDSRILSACQIGHARNRIFIGQHDALERLAQFMEGGIYVGKNIFNKGFFPGADLLRYHELKNRGFTIVHLDEEGGNYIGDSTIWKDFLSMRLDPRVLAKEDRICAWGDFQRDHYRSLSPACSENIASTGHPKFDLLKPALRRYFQPEVDRLRGRLGDFLLVNTNLTAANNPLGNPDSFSERAGYFPRDQRKRSHYIGYWRHSACLLGSLIGLVDALSNRFKNINIVIRPHPTEDFQFYRAIFQSTANVKVLHEGSVSPWLLACKALVHNGCTTAIESFFADTRVVSYVPFSDERYDFPLPNLIGMQCRTEEEVFEIVRESFGGGAARQVESVTAFREKAAPLFFNIEGDSIARFSEAIAFAESAPSPRPSRFDWVQFSCAEASYRARNLAKRCIRPFFPDKQRDFLFYNGPGNFPGFRFDDISARFANAQRVLGKEVRWKLLSPELISVEAG